MRSHPSMTSLSRSAYAMYLVHYLFVTWTQRALLPFGIQKETELAGWGANLKAKCFLVEPHSAADVRATLDHSGTIARELGRSYGDCAINADRQVVQTTKMNRLLAFDDATGTLTCEGGTSLEAVIAAFAGRGWFPMITPGTKFVTVAVASPMMYTATLSVAGAYLRSSGAIGTTSVQRSRRAMKSRIRDRRFG